AIPVIIGGTIGGGTIGGGPAPGRSPEGYLWEVSGGGVRHGIRVDGQGRAGGRRSHGSHPGTSGRPPAARRHDAGALAGRSLPVVQQRARRVRRAGSEAETR